MKWAIISDLHANMEALEHVLKDIRNEGLTKQDIICLGDLVGYGPNPAECVEIAKEFRLCLKGNHDEAVVNEALGFNPLAREAVDWHRSQLKPYWLSSKAKKIRWDFLKGLPATKTEERCYFVHGSPRDPTMEYILRADCEDLLGEVPSKIKDIFSRFEWLCFVGHTHDPGVITENSKFVSPRDLNGSFEVPPDKKLIVNVGSVGQPRDGDNRACYVIFDGKKLDFRRVEYDPQATRQKILGIPELDPRIGERLLYGR
ncbi:MAG: metallophosphoesterase family protein [Planctomycetes bacterium]|nr:metallophosphoesterase family protein [Planctomycetota bacterium]